jgi:cholesterol transport system auxiliary component
MKRLIASFCVVLAGCALGGRSGASFNVYDFGPPATPLPAQGLAKLGAGIALDVRAPSWFDSPGIDYRLDYEDSLRRRQYAESRWAAAPAPLLARQLRQQLGLSGGDGGANACQLRVEVQEFSQVFATPASSQGVLQARVLLLDAKRGTIAERPFAIATLASTQDASGGAHALVQSGLELGRQVSGWIVALEAQGKLAACSSGR